jgi:hypothetical protein
VRDEFVRYFFIGFTNYTGSMSGGAGGSMASRLVRSFGCAHPDQVQATFETFRLLAHEAEGVWTPALNKASSSRAEKRAGDGGF